MRMAQSLTHTMITTKKSAYTCCNTWLNGFQLRAQDWAPANLQHL